MLMNVLSDSNKYFIFWQQHLLKFRANLNFILFSAIVLLAHRKVNKQSVHDANDNYSNIVIIIAQHSVVLTESNVCIFYFYH